MVLRLSTSTLPSPDLKSLSILVIKSMTLPLTEASEAHSSLVVLGGAFVAC